MRSVWRWCFVGSLCAVLVIMLLPSGPGSMLPGQDKVLHGVTFLLLYLLGAKAFPQAGYRNKLLVRLLGYGIAIELLQGLSGYRSMEAWDAVADMAGLLVGWLWVLKKQPSQGCCG
ncbi:VanZ family protein [Porticoccus sp.]